MGLNVIRFPETETAERKMAKPFIEVMTTCFKGELPEGVFKLLVAEIDGVCKEFPLREELWSFQLELVGATEKDVDLIRKTIQERVVDGLAKSRSDLFNALMKARIKLFLAREGYGHLTPP